MKKKIWSVIPLAGVMVLTAANFSACTVTTETNANNEIAVLYTNDVHCGFENGNDSAGIAGLAGYKAVTEVNYGTDNVTMIDAGDFIQGEAIGTISEGTYPVDLMNYVGYDIGTVGNHEFDYGMDALLGEDGLVAQNNMQYVACNFRYTGGDNEESVFDPYIIVEYDKISIAYIGIATPETFTKSTPTYFQDENGNWAYSFCEENDGADLYAAVQESIDEAKAEGADYVVAVSHLGTDEAAEPFRSTDVIANTTGLDVVLDGHSHSVIEQETVRDKAGEKVILTSTGTKLANVGKLVIDTNGTTSTADDKITTELVGAAEINRSTSFLQRMAYETADDYYQSVVAQYSDLLNEVVATSEAEMSINYENGARAVRNSETAIGDFCADAYRAATGADIAFVNGGGIRAGIPQGDITYEDIIGIHPYGNTICMVEATGEQILNALELGNRAVQAEAYTQEGDGYSEVGELGGFLQVSGIQFTVDTSVESTVVTDANGMFVEVAGERRVKDVQVYNGETDTYEDIDPTATYTLASHNYLLKSAGDGFNMFLGCNLLLDETALDNQVLIRYIQDVLGGTITSDYIATLTGRINITGRA